MIDTCYLSEVIRPHQVHYIWHVTLHVVWLGVTRLLQRPDCLGKVQLVSMTLKVCLLYRLVHYPFMYVHITRGAYLIGDNQFPPQAINNI